VSRNARIILFIAAVAVVAGLSSCYLIPFGAYGYISAGQLRTFESLGLTINEGKDPPDITGTYLCNSLVLKGTNIPDDWPLGTSFDDMEITFYSQNDDGTVLVSYAQDTENGTGLGAFISGSGSDFTVYAQINGSSDGIEFEDAMVFSGRKTAGGITYFEYGLMLTDKSYDPYDDLIEVGDARVFDENDGLAAFGSLPSIHPAMQKPAGSAR
jgi:hypothetical protein